MAGYAELMDLVAWVNQERETAQLHPLLIIALCVVVFLEIHPFQDGNGRLSRVLTTLLLLQAGYAYVPYSSLESVVEQSKESYYLALRQTQGTIRTESPNWQPWLVLFLRCLVTPAAPRATSPSPQSHRQERRPCRRTVSRPSCGALHHHECMASRAIILRARSARPTAPASGAVLGDPQRDHVHQLAHSSPSACAISHAGITCTPGANG